MLASLLLSAEPPGGGVTSGHSTGREEGGWGREMSEKVMTKFRIKMTSDIKGRRPHDY